ncbi:MAG: ABC transporter ATP-binding protein [Alphaproteobacteria bacterium]|nr:ABC transporter ATP-binding protein [Alphaproteobacteria bacterium]
MSAMVEIDRLSKAFGPIVAVDNISLTVKKGEVLGFLGPNGAGKTTTMRMLAGFLTPSSGTAKVCGHDVVEDPIAVKRVLGYMPEGAPAYDDMTVAAFLSFVAAVRGLEGADIQRRVHEISETVDLNGMLDRPIEYLSKGYKRRVGLAQTLLHDPPVLVLDEPTDGLDPNQKHQVRSLIKRMAAEKCIVISTHILEEVEAACTRAVIIGNGKLLADGTAEQLLARLPDHGAVTIECAAEHVDRVTASLGKVSTVGRVAQIDLGPGRNGVRAHPSSGQSIVEAVSSALRADNVPFAEVYRHRGSLDDVFRLITRGSDRAAA